MATCKEWLNQKFVDWEKSQGRSQSYYAFARYLGVGQNELALWMDGSSVPVGDDLAAIADKLGAEVYDTLALARPNTANQRLTASVAGLPSGLRDRLTNAILEADQVLKNRRLPPESVDAKLAVVEVFLKWGIKLTN